MLSSPFEWVRIPNGIKRRERRLRHGEYDALTKAAQSRKNVLVWTLLDFAIETGMRRSEVLILRWEHLSDPQRIASLPDTKNGSKRDVPLTQKATEPIIKLPAKKDYVFPTSDYDVRHAWDRLVKRAGIKKLRF